MQSSAQKPSASKEARRTFDNEAWRKNEAIHRALDLPQSEATLAQEKRNSFSRIFDASEEKLDLDPRDEGSRIIRGQE